MIIGNLKDGPIIRTPEEIAIDYARKYEGDAAAERLREYFDQQREHKNQLAVGMTVYILAGIISAFVFTYVF